MDDFSNFFTSVLCTAVFCAAVTLGLILALSRRQFCKGGQAQKLMGGTMVLLAIHIFSLEYESFFHVMVNPYLFYILLLLDAGLFALIITIIFRHLRVGTKTSAEGLSDVAGVEEDDDEGEDAVQAQPLESLNVDDYLFFQKVESLMVNDRLFCEQELSREVVAAAIGTNRTYLVRSIKNATGKTFSEYIADLRTSYAATLLTTTEEPLDKIGTMCGFRSKSTYYRAFALAYGCTPSEYRKKSTYLKALEK